MLAEKIGKNVILKVRYFIGRNLGYIISAGDLKTSEMFDILSKATVITVPAEAPKPLVRVIGNILDPIGRLFSWQPPLSRERVHYIYDRCVRVEASKARQELGWQPRSVEETLRDIVKEMGAVRR